MISILTGTYEQWQLPEGFESAELDLGCGKGGFLVDLAQKYPERLIVGADIMRGRLYKVRHKARKAELENVHLLRANGLDLAGYLLPEAAFSRIHVLCPDPWPKARHHNRRLLCSEVLGRLCTKVVPGGILHLSTDHDEYFEFMLTAIAPLRQWARDDEGIADIRDMKTDFERQWNEQGKIVNHAAFRRV